jgi:hypothetical protein
LENSEIGGGGREDEGDNKPMQPDQPGRPGQGNPGQPAKGCQVKATPVREILEPASLVSKTPAAKCFFEL